MWIVITANSETSSLNKCNLIYNAPIKTAVLYNADCICITIISLVSEQKRDTGVHINVTTFRFSWQKCSKNGTSHKNQSTRFHRQPRNSEKVSFFKVIKKHLKTWKFIHIDPLIESQSEKNLKWYMRSPLAFSSVSIYRSVDLRISEDSAWITDPWGKKTLNQKVLFYTRF